MERLFLKKILLCVVILAASAQAGFITLNLWQKDDQKVVVLGDRCTDIVIRAEDKLWPEDKKQWFVLRTALGKMNSGKDNQIALLTDIASKDDFIAHSLPHLKKAETRADLLYVGMHMKLNELVTTDHYQGKGISAIGYDLRDHVLENPINFVSCLSDTQQIPDHQKRQKIILKSLSEATTAEYLEKLDAFTKELPLTPSCVMQARTFFMSRDRGDSTTLMRDILLQERQQIGSDEQFYEENSWMFELNELLATVGLKKALTAILKSHKAIILYAGQAHAITANEHMQIAGYSPVVSAGKQDRAEKEEEHYLSPDFLENMLRKFTSNESCCMCESLTKQKCSRCKLVYYCSRECQRTDWTAHKLTCKKK